MPKYTVEIVETTVRSIVVEAESADKARHDAEYMWNEWEIDMDDYDYYDIDFRIDE